MSSGTTALKRARTSVAQVVRGITTVLALVLVVGAILIAIGDSVNRDNGVVQLITDVAGAVDGPFSRENGVFSFDGEGLTAITNWGIAAAVWLLIGRVLAGLIDR